MVVVWGIGFQVWLWMIGVSLPFVRPGCPHPRIKSGAGSSPLPLSGRGDGCWWVVVFWFLFALLGDHEC